MKVLKKRIILYALTFIMVLFVPQILKSADTNIYAKSKSTGTSITLEVGDKISLKVKGGNKNASWKSSDKKVAKVSKTGIVTAKNKGGAVITAKIKKKTYKCKIIVKNKKIEQSAITERDESQPYGVNEVLDLVNELRAEKGLKPLILDSKLNSAANIRANECGEVYSHTRPNGTSCFTAFDEVGITKWQKRGENIAKDYSTAQEVVTAWMNSTAHRENILNEKYEYIGIAFVQVNGHLYWVQEFLTR